MPGFREKTLILFFSCGGGGGEEVSGSVNPEHPGSPTTGMLSSWTERSTRAAEIPQPYQSSETGSAYQRPLPAPTLDLMVFKDFGHKHSENKTICLDTFLSL